MSQGQNREKIGTRHGKDSKFDRQDRDLTWRIQAHHLDLKRGENTFTVQLQALVKFGLDSSRSRFRLDSKIDTPGLYSLG